MMWFCQTSVNRALVLQANTTLGDALYKADWSVRHMTMESNVCVSCVGLTDNILHSVLKKGCRQLQSLDLCGSPHLLTDYALDLIGT